MSDDVPRDKDGVPLVLANKLYAKLSQPEPRAQLFYKQLDVEIEKKFYSTLMRKSALGIESVYVTQGTATGRMVSSARPWMRFTKDGVQSLKEKDEDD